MKIGTDELEIKTSEDFKEHSFGIRSEDQGFILDILRSKMYSNPIHIICQEIASNARDANRESGKSHTPIRIKIENNPLKQETLFVVEDDGPGISPERMQEIYVNYGASTKRDTNRMSGGFGLGCKTPFSYTDSFSVITRVDGVKYTYQAAVQSNKTGSVFLVHQESTEEPNGTSVVIPIDRWDVEAFEKACLYVTHFWSVMPKFEGTYFKEECKTIKVTETEKLFIIKKTFRFSAGYYALIDGIPYSLDYEHLEWKELRELCVFLKFKNGVISIAANREAVHYDPDTDTTLKKKLNEFVEDLFFEVQKAIADIEDIREAGIRASYELGRYEDLLRRNTVDWKDKKLNFSNPFRYLRVVRYHQHQRKTFYAVPDPNSKIYKMDLKLINKFRNEEIYKISPEFYLISNVKEDKPETIQEFEVLKKIVGEIPDYSSVRYTRTRVSAEIIKKSKEEIKLYAVSGGGALQRHTHIRSELPALDAFYIEFEFVNMIDSNKVKWAHLISNISKKKAFFLKKKQTNLVKDSWKTYEKVFGDCLEKLKKFSDPIYLNNTGSAADGYKNLIFGESVEELLSYVRKNSKDALCHPGCYVPSNFLEVFPPSATAKKAIELLNAIDKNYPLLRRASYSADTKHINEYIKLIDKERPWILDGWKQQII